MAKTRGVFAVITQYKTLLLSERMDGKGWNLPGGRVEEGETDQVALVREVEEETGLKVEVLHKVGNKHIFNDDTAVAYACKVVGGMLKQTAEAKVHRYVTAQEVRQGYYFVPKEEYSLWEQDYHGDVPTDKKTLKLVGPEGRLGRTGRMVWDAFSLMEEATKVGWATEKRAMLAQIPINTVICFQTVFCERRDQKDLDYIWEWPRLDPYSPTGKMEIK